MPALPARHIASSALCAALLVGITGPAAMAADSARERSHSVPREARHPSTEVLLAKVRKLDKGELAPVADLMEAALKADNGQLPPAEARKLAAAAKKAAAKTAAKAPATPARPKASAPGTGVLLHAPTKRAIGVTKDLDDLESAVEEALDAVEEAIDDLLEAISSDGLEVDVEDDATDADVDDLTGLDDLDDLDDLGDVIEADVEDAMTDLDDTTDATEADDTEVLPSVSGLLDVVGKLIGALLDTGLPVVSILPSTSTATTAPAPPAVTLPATTPQARVLPPAR